MPMQKVGVVADSIACVPPEIVRQYDLRVVPLNISYDGKVYREGLDITSAEAYQLLAAAPDHWGTSPGSAGDYLSAYRELGARFPAVLCVTLSARLSTLHNVARLAKEQAERELDGVRIELLDSRNASAGETLIVLAAARAAGAGKELDEVVRITRDVRDRVRVVGIFDTIRHVYRSGRIPRTAARMISTFNVRPMFTIAGGTVNIAGVDTNKERGIRRLLSAMKGKLRGRPIRAAVAHANVPEQGQQLRDRLAAEFNCIECWLTDFSPIMGYATGEGTLVIAYHEEENDD